MDEASVKPNSLNSRPIRPDKNDIGMKTAHSTAVVAMTAKPISFEPSIAASILRSPTSIRR